MKLEVIGQQGIKYQETIDYAVILKKEGEFAILDKHIQTLTTLHNEFIKLVQNDLYNAITRISNIIYTYPCPPLKS